MLTTLFVALLLIMLGVRIWLSIRQIRHVMAHRDAVPIEFASKIGLSSHQRAADYTVAKARLNMLEMLFDAAVLIALTLLGGLQYIDTLTSGMTSHALLKQVLLLMSVFMLFGVLGMPFALYRQFKLEAHFGFNRMTLKMFMSDTIKEVMLGALLGIPLMAAILWLMAEAGSLWWLWAWSLWTGFSLLVAFIYPTWIAPIFNKFTPLNDIALAERIQELASRCGFTLSGLFVMDGSKRSAHGNAYFTGFGRARRIVFYDTLLARLTQNEIIAVLAHELGHFKHRHILKRMITMFIGSFIFFALLGWLATQSWFYTDLGVIPQMGGRNDAMALLLFFLVVPVFTFGLTPIKSWLSRRDEFEADRFARDQSSAQELANALVKLLDDNAATLTPDPVHSAFYDGHPPAAIRIRQLTSA